MLYFVEKWIEKKYFSIKNNLALYDQLTGIYNYNWFTKFGLDIFSDKDVYITLMDLNNFKQINDTKGHMYANEILIEIVKKLSKIVSKEDPEAIMVRYGGDEFLILSTNIDFGEVMLSKDHLENFISVGSYKKDSYESIMFAIDKADKAMYDHKGKVKEKNHGKSFDRLVKEYKCFKNSHLQ